jgi:hypothetical protein
MANDPTSPSPLPGEKWRAHLQPVDKTNSVSPEATVTLRDFDARTDTWTVQPEGQVTTVALPAKCLIARVH